jgi:glycosyltransferase involved in cell wall biosynthesis
MRAMRLAVYCDYTYRVRNGSVSAELPFSLFVNELASHCERLTVVGRRDPAEEDFPYRVRASRFVALPFYGSGADLRAVLATVPVAIRRFWLVLDDSDVVWILGPNPPHAILFALLGLVRRRRVVLGVRQNLPELIRHRRPGKRAVLWTAWLLEGGFRLLARLVPVVVVGPDLAARYRGGRSVLSIYVSLLRSADLLSPGEVERDYDAGSLVMLSVGRLDPEKNPVLLADILCEALLTEPRWRLVVCGGGTLQEALLARAEELGVADRLQMRGYVPIDGGLWGLYRDAHALLHVSLTEGVPQVILEAFAARLPVVGTEVGGVGAVLTGRGLLVPPQDAEAAAKALNRLVHDPQLRAELVDEAARAAEDHTLEAEGARVAGFLSMKS